MKTSELIRRLQEADPTGELECVVDATADVLFVEPAPYYYDGTPWIAVRDQHVYGYNVTGLRLLSEPKLILRTFDPVLALVDDPNLKIETCGSPRAAEKEAELRAKAGDVVKESE
jgi:hypothetical protein